MPQDIKFYEKKIIQGKEFPVTMHINRNREDSVRYQIFEPHWHEHIELHYVIKGEFEAVLDHKQYIAKAGDLVLINSNVLHTGYCKGEMEVQVMIFEMEAVSEELAEKNVLFEQIIRADEEINRIMTGIYKEGKEQEIGYRIQCKGLLLQLLIYLTRNYGKGMLSDKESARRIRRLARFNTVIRYVQDHYSEPITNKELADLVQLSEDRFNHLFKECMGVSPLQYINEIRLNKAMHLLKTGEYSSSEVAELAGFSDYNYFGRIFRRTYGCTPSQMKQLQGNRQ